MTFDPEGALSKISALATLLMGVLAGELIFKSRATAMPLIKKIWTPTFALFSGGFALTAFAFFYFVNDVMRWQRWSVPAAVFGSNAIFAFALSTVITMLADRVHVHEWGYRGFWRWGCCRCMHRSCMQWCWLR